MRDDAGEESVGLSLGDMSPCAKDAERRLRRERRLSACSIFIEVERVSGEQVGLMLIMLSCVILVDRRW